VISLSVHSEELNAAILRYAQYLGKDLGIAVEEQARLLARRLADLTPPFNRKQGTKAVDRDIGRVYLRNEWFTEIFVFRNPVLNQRVQDEVRAQDTAALQDIFKNSSKLQRLHIESFDPARHAKARDRRTGKVTYPEPFSFPLTEQSKVKSYTRTMEKAVGSAKSGWGYCVVLLGGKVPAWFGKPLGSVENRTHDERKPLVRMTNNVGYFDSLDSRQNIVSRAMEGRQRDMITAAQRALEAAGRKAGL